jgi:hypothetical protein
MPVAPPPPNVFPESQQHSQDDTLTRTKKTRRRTNKTAAHLRRHPTELAMETLSPTSVWNSLMAGYAAGTTGTLIGHPLDSVKVWMQTSNHPYQTTTNTLISSSSKPSTFAGISTHRLRALYAGISGPLLSVGLVQSINFAVYDASRRMLYGLDHPDADPDDDDYLHSDSLVNVALASMSAGLVLAPLTLPMITIKTQQQLRPELSFRQAFLRIVPSVFVDSSHAAPFMDGNLWSSRLLWDL